MSNPFQSLMQDAGFPLLQQQLGEAVSRYASGTGSALSVTAIVDDESDGGQEVTSSSGVMRIRQKRLQVAASQAVTIDDQWAISGERWQTVAVTDAHDGMKIVIVQRTDQQKTVRSRPHG
ncbi:MAG: hypothetical protein E6R03_15295 [Hyphomicrobiaceae bacterium]|nr:MAG: hypothetical protein E6R03_15295 [Hyphomicrobiaceae bacterium]